MKKKSRIEIERKIVSRVKREMDQPRLTESVRNGFSVQEAVAVKKPAARSALA
jgi:transcriptional regulator of NAD metabolism